jgi:hypothetical protein
LFAELGWNYGVGVGAVECGPHGPSRAASRGQLDRYLTDA